MMTIELIRVMRIGAFFCNHSLEYYDECLTTGKWSVGASHNVT